MDAKNNFLADFRSTFEEGFYESLKKSKNLKMKDAESIAFALHDISESIEKIYQVLVPQFIQPNITEEQIHDLIFDLKSEFEHVLYHIEDAKLYNLKAWEE